MSFGFGFAMPRIFYGSRAFNPASLFANGEQGWWFDPSNFATLFQDSAGTTPVTAVEQPVGLQLDLSQGGVPGPELFSSFTSTGTWTVSGTTYSITSAAAQTDLRVDYTGTTGKRYVISFTASGVSGTVIFYPLNTNPPAVVNGTNIIRQVSDAGFFIIRATTGASATISNISAKELPGNHRFQTNSGNRPVVSALVNLLTKTEDFANAAWTKLNSTITANSTIAPDGTLTGDKMVADTTSNFHYGSRPITLSPGVYTYSIYAKAGEYNTCFINFPNDTTLSTFNLTTGVLISAAFGVTASITSVGNGWYRLVCIYTYTTGLINPFFGLQTGSFTGDGTSGIFIWGADLRYTNQGVDLPAYQRVNTSTDYDSVGFPVYIKPNGSNQFMQTNSIDFTATDKMTLWQGVRKLSDSAQSVVAELSASISANNGAFLLAAPNSAAANYNFASKGTTQVDNIVTTYTSPITNVLVAAGGISGPVNSVKVNNGAATTVTSSQGTGNYGNYAAYFYSRAGSSLYFNGNDYGSIARGAASTAAQITDGETWINQRTKAY